VLLARLSRQRLSATASQVFSFSISLCHHLLATGRFLTMHPVVMARLGKYLALKRLGVDFAGIPRPVGISPLARLFIDCARKMAKPLIERQQRTGFY
jgi:hypothetical protein